MIVLVLLPAAAFMSSTLRTLLRTRELTAVVVLSVAWKPARRAAHPWS
ncbi:MAG: hypothetical protein ABIR80_12570 [Opitutaceae bacterium]